MIEPSAKPGSVYAQMSGETAKYAKEQAGNIKYHAGEAIKNIVRIGTILIEVKARLPHGAWLPWLSEEFAWSDMSAKNFMRVAKTFKTFKSKTGFDLHELDDIQIEAKALYELARPTTDLSTQVAVVERAQQGEPITRAVVKEEQKRQAVVFDTEWLKFIEELSRTAGVIERRGGIAEVSKDWDESLIQRVVPFMEKTLDQLNEYLAYLKGRLTDAERSDH